MSNKNLIDGKTELVGLIGWPVKHSLSPTMHNAAFNHLGLNWVYVPLPVQPLSIEPALRGLAALGIAGANVTVPHKQAIMRYIDRLDDAARIIGAVNTIQIRDGEFFGYNTDAGGFLNSLVKGNGHPKDLRVAVLGAGGAARAVVYALAQAEAHLITVFNRTAERAAFLVDDLADAFPDSHLKFAPLNQQVLETLGNQVDLIINTTSVGMSPRIDSCPWPDDVPLPKDAIVCDLVYNPLETLLLARARENGNPTIDGLGMLINQGADAFEIWTGQQPPIDVMRAACLAGLNAKSTD